jgi:hypothetical protein
MQTMKWVNIQGMESASRQSAGAMLGTAAMGAKQHLRELVI